MPLTRNLCARFFNDATKLGIDHPDIDTLIADRTKTLALRYIHDDDHFINDFLSQCPYGRYLLLNIEPCGEEIVSYAI